MTRRVGGSEAAAKSTKDTARQPSSLAARNVKSCQKFFAYFQEFFPFTSHTCILMKFLSSKKVNENNIYHILNFSKH